MTTKTNKRCKKCGALKPLTEFYQYKKAKDGHQSNCKVCSLEISRQWRAENPKKVKEDIRRWRAKNPGKTRESCHQWYIKNAGRVRERKRQWRAENAEKIRESKRRWRAENPEKIREIRRREHKKHRSTPEGKLRTTISNAMCASLKGSKAGRHWKDLVGYTIDQLKKHLEKRFQPGMSWENYGKWHLDHRVPQSVFNFETPEDIDFKRCWALKNLQPMWAKENKSKGAKLDKPFQPSLIF
ncbi:MAG: hypothetical protein WC401_07365 [Bacteroidales bacterium]|jgi:hypothetical protein